MSNLAQSNTITSCVVVIFIASVCVVSAADAGTVFTWRDDAGGVQYADTCPPGAQCIQQRVGFPEKPEATVGGVGRMTVESGGAAVGETSIDGNGSQEGEANRTGSGKAAGTGNAAQNNTSGSGRGLSAKLSWGAVIDNKVQGYRVLYGIAGTVQGDIAREIDVGNRTTYTINGLERGTEYVFVVRAVDASGAVMGASIPTYASLP